MQRALAPDICTWTDEQPTLIGTRCEACGATTFPKQERCPRCGDATMTELLLPRRGTLIAWTTQGFVPKLPYAGRETAETFEPFGVGLVQLDDVVRVEGRLTESDPAKLESLVDVELTVVPFFVDEDGTEVMTFAFAPVAPGN